MVSSFIKMDESKKKDVRGPATIFSAMGKLVQFLAVNGGMLKNGFETLPLLQCSYFRADYRFLVFNPFSLGRGNGNNSLDIVEASSFTLLSLVHGCGLYCMYLHNRFA